MKRKVLFIVQGEGRGHMTQALSLGNLMKKNGYEITSVLMGIGSHRELPSYFINSVGAPVKCFLSPSFVTKNNRGVRPLPTLTQNIGKLSEWRKSIDFIGKIIREDNPDLIINFYEPIVGLYYRFKNPGIPMICIAHQYLSAHPDYRHPKGKAMDRQFLRSWSKLTSSGASLKLALSFYPMNDDLHHNIVVVPPLLRSEVFDLQPMNKGYFLIYIANRGYRDDILEWHRQYPGIPLHCFMEGNEFGDEYYYHRNLCFHRLNDKKFLSMMAGARGLVSTAGFEAICEAYYLGKPSLMVPVEGHYEQYCNAIDAHRAGAGIFEKTFRIEKLLAYSEGCHLPATDFRKWVDQAENIILRAIDEVLTRANAA